MPEPIESKYLGDGVYASHDGYQFKLSASDNVIYLDNQVTEAFLRMVDDLKPKNDEKDTEQ